jgi:hypothetical protein
MTAQRIATVRLLVLALFGLGLFGAPPARADAPVVKLVGAPIAKDTSCFPGLAASQIVAKAGTFTDFCAAYYVQGGAPEADDPKHVVFDTPQGFLATSDVSPQCTLAQYAAATTSASRCAADTQIGDGQAMIRLALAGLPIAQSAPVKVFNLEHSDDELGKVGLELAPEIGGIPLPHTKLIARITLRPAPDVGLRTIIDGLPQSVDLGFGAMPIATDGFFMRFWGTKADHPTLKRDFAFLGTDCSQPQVTTVTSTSWAGDVSTQRYEYPLQGCDQVHAGVSGSVVTSEHRPDVPTEMTVSVKPSVSTTNQNDANFDTTEVTLPTGLDLAGQIAGGPDGLPLCTPEQYAWTSTAPSTCPAKSEVGSVAFTSPLLKTVFTGRVFLGTQPHPADLPEVYIEARMGSLPDSPSVKVIGHMSFDDQHRIVTTLPNLPQMIFGEFKLTFRGGDHSVLATPRACGTTDGLVRSVPSTGGPDVSASFSLSIDQDCVDPSAFTPSVVVGSSTTQAGATGVTTISVTRQDRQARISRVAADLPPGVLANLTGVDTCPQASADAGSCPAGSRIGSVTSTAGVGPVPTVIRGDVYLSDPPAGAAAGVTIIVPVKFGDVDLGVLSLPARIDLRQSDLGLSISADIPLRFRGFPLDLRSFDLALDRPGFGLNPTNCAPLTAKASLVPDLGPVASAPSTMQMTGCDALAFEPSISTSLTGSTAAYGRPGVNVKLSLPAGNQAIRRAQVTMPIGLAADPKAAGRTCTLPQFESQSCPSSAIVGSAAGQIAITPETLTGPVYLVSVPGTVLPGIGIQFEGRFASRFRGTLTVSKSSLIVADFATVPDVPLTSLDLTFAPGPGSALIASAALCKAPSIVFAAHFEGYAGKTRDTTAVTHCAGAQSAVARATLSARFAPGLRLRITPPPTQKLKSAVITLPAGVTVNRKVLTKAGRVRGLKGAFTLTRSGSRTLKVGLKSATSKALVVAVPRAVLQFGTAAKKAKTLTIKVKATLSAGASQSLSAKASGKR